MARRDVYQLIIARRTGNGKPELVYQDSHGVLTTTDNVPQGEADAEALGNMAKRLKFSARRMRKDARKADNSSPHGG